MSDLPEKVYVRMVLEASVPISKIQDSIDRQMDGGFEEGEEPTPGDDRWRAMVIKFAEEWAFDSGDEFLDMCGPPVDIEADL